MCKKPLIILMILVTLTGCASSIRGKSFYYSKEIAIQPNDERYEDLNDLIILIDDKSVNISDHKFYYGIESDRVLKFNNNCVDIYISVFNDNCFKPRRARKFILSRMKNDLVPYSRNNHNSSDMIKTSDEIALSIIKK